MGFLKPRYGMNGRELNILWQTGRKTVDVYLVRFPTFGFKKKLVALLIRKTIDFVLDGRTIPWSGALNSTNKHRTAVKSSPKDVMDLPAGIRKPTTPLLGRQFIRHITERRWDRVALLFFQPGVINGPPI